MAKTGIIKRFDASLRGYAIANTIIMYYCVLKIKEGSKGVDSLIGGVYPPKVDIPSALNVVPFKPWFPYI